MEFRGSIEKTRPLKIRRSLQANPLQGLFCLIRCKTSERIHHYATGEPWRISYQLQDGGMANICILQCFGWWWKGKFLRREKDIAQIVVSRMGTLGTSMLEMNSDMHQVEGWPLRSFYCIWFHHSQETHHKHYQNTSNPVALKTTCQLGVVSLVLVPIWSMFRVSDGDETQHQWFPYRWKVADSKG